MWACIAAYASIHRSCALAVQFARACESTSARPCNGLLPNGRKLHLGGFHFSQQAPAGKATHALPYSAAAAVDAECTGIHNGQSGPEADNVPKVCKCRVSFTDSEAVSHSVEVIAGSLYEAAVLALAPFRRCGFTDAIVGLATRLTVAVQAPATTHELAVRKVEA